MKEAMERTHRWLDRCVEEHGRLMKALRTNSRNNDDTLRAGDGSGGAPNDFALSKIIGEEKTRQDPPEG